MSRVVDISDKLTIKTKLRCIELAKEINQSETNPDVVFDFAKDLAEWCLDPTVGLLASFFPTKRKNTSTTKSKKR